MRLQLRVGQQVREQYLDVFGFRGSAGRPRVGPGGKGLARLPCPVLHRVSIQPVDLVPAQRILVAKRDEYHFYLREKFTGTCSCHALTGNMPLAGAQIFFVVLFQSGILDSTTRGTIFKKLKSSIPESGDKTLPWKYTVTTLVLNLDEWNEFLPQYPARLV